MNLKKHALNSLLNKSKLQSCVEKKGGGERSNQTSTPCPLIPEMFCCYPKATKGKGGLNLN